MRRGLTLMETLLAVALLGSCLLGMLTVIVGGLGLSARTEQVTYATELAREEMETIKERGYLWLPEGTVRFVGAPRVNGFPPDPYPTQSRDGHKYDILVSVGDVAAQVRSVVVEVRCDERIMVTLETYLHP